MAGETSGVVCRVSSAWIARVEGARERGFEVVVGGGEAERVFMPLVRCSMLFGWFSIAVEMEFGILVGYKMDVWILRYPRMVKFIAVIPQSKDFYAIERPARLEIDTTRVHRGYSQPANYAE